MTGKEYLQRIKKIDTQLKNKAFELEQTKKLGLSAGAILDNIQKLNAEKAEIIRNIERLPEAEYDVLHKIYVQGKTLYEVASDRDMSYSNATTIHGKALKSLDKIINCE